MARGSHPLPHDLGHCPQCGSEQQSGTDDSIFECLACEYTEKEMAA
jgi:ribosomal protein L37AE/L43A